MEKEIKGLEIIQNLTLEHQDYDEIIDTLAKFKEFLAVNGANDGVEVVESAIDYAKNDAISQIWLTIHAFFEHEVETRIKDKVVLTKVLDEIGILEENPYLVKVVNDLISLLGYSEADGSDYIDIAIKRLITSVTYPELKFVTIFERTEHIDVNSLFTSDFLEVVINEAAKNDMYVGVLNEKTEELITLWTVEEAKEYIHTNFNTTSIYACLGKEEVKAF